MKKTIITVFLVLAALVLALLVWELFFSDDGILHSVYNSVAEGVNHVFTNFTGGDNQLVPYWGDEKVNQYNDQTEGEKTDTFSIDN